MKLYSLSIKLEIGFEDVLEAVIESGKLDILGYNIEFPADENNIAIANIYNENTAKLESNFDIIKNYLDMYYDYSISELDSEEYLTSYMECLKPFKVGEITIVPNLRDNYKYLKEPVIYIAKQYAFGSGCHETTSLALYMINEYSKNNDMNEKSVADIGCGSGILSLFSRKLGAKNVVSVDMDRDAVNCALDNSRYNGIKLDNIILGEAKDLNDMNLKFDLVAANIETDVLTEIMPELKKLLKKDSFLIISGILLEKEPLIDKAIAENGLNVIDRKIKNDWAALSLNL